MPTTDHGRRISGAEYDRRMIRLQESLPELPSAGEDLEHRRRELDVRIDHRLGVDFPAERREAVWRVQQRLDRRRLRHAAGALLRRVFRADSDSRHAALLADATAAGFREVLDDEELASFLELEPGDVPALPIDVER